MVVTKKGSSMTLSARAMVSTGTIRSEMHWIRSVVPASNVRVSSKFGKTVTAGKEGGEERGK